MDQINSNEAIILILLVGISIFKNQNSYTGNRSWNGGGFNGIHGNAPARKQQWNSNKPQCQLCGKFGRVAFKCYHRFDPTFQCFSNSSYGPHTSFPSSSSMSANVAAMMATPKIVADHNWYPDSGATNHSTTDVNNLMQNDDYYGNDQVHMGDGAGLPI